MKNKLKIVLTVMVMILGMSILAACGSNESKTEQTSSTGSSTDSSDNAEKTFSLKMNSNYPKYEGLPGIELPTDVFSEQVKEKTNNQVDIEVFFSSQLVPTEQTLDAVRSGTVDLAHTTAYWSEILPTADLLMLPLAFEGPDHFLHVMTETDVRSIMEEEFAENGVKLLQFWSNGPYGLMTNKPIETIEDFKGQALRSGVASWEPWLKELGVAPSVISPAEQYQAISQGIVDGSIYGIAAVEVEKFHEILDYLIVPAIQDPVLGFVIMNLDKWNQLPQDVQDTITEVALELEAQNMELIKEQTQHYIDFAKDNGMTVIEIEDNEWEKIVDSAQILFDEYEGKNERTKQILDIINETRDQFR